jgi:cytochrome c-type biogenesis protein CcmF
MLSLAYAFITDDFSVNYVAANSNLELPVFYKISALWSAHEGSLLLWVWMLAFWMQLVAWLARHLPDKLIASVLSVMGAVTVGFTAFTLFTSNPFERTLPFAPRDGSDLNPLLQDIGLIIHPPMLYMGYVGFSVAFAFAIAALINGRLDSSWARWTRPWTLAAWLFMTLGIALGSWWAYYELGWGGWWFWDPVENASFMPWLAGTALIHSLAATEKRGLFKSWTLLLAILAFSLSLLGTFLVRSGVLTSVHAFAADPERGYFILLFLALVIGGSLTLFAIRAPLLKSAAVFEVQSKETALLINNIILFAAMLIVLLGTLYPLLADALGWGKISVGPPYFNFFFVPMMLVLLAFMPLGVMANWKKSAFSQHKSVFLGVLCASLVLALAYVYSAGGFEAGVVGQDVLLLVIALTLVFWSLMLTFRDVVFRTRHGDRFHAFIRLSRSYKGMFIAHTGLIMTVAGVALTSVFSESMDVRMEMAQPVEMGKYRFLFEDIELVEGQNYVSDRATIRVMTKKTGKAVVTLYPEKRRYNSDRGNMMTEAAIDPGLFADIYVSMGEPLDEKREVWAVRLHHKPFVRFIWLGSILMALGAALGISDRRYRASQGVRI